VSDIEAFPGRVMQDAAAFDAAPRFEAAAGRRAERIVAVPWYLWCAALAVTSAYVGGYWDISWHRSIGRDTFWSPPHMAIYACGVLAAVASAYLIGTATFDRTSPLANASVRIWGLRAPIGAFFSAWGGMAMLVSAPFDDWWHNAYGLDVKIISPPHMILALGFFGIEIGTVLLLLAFLNRSGAALRAPLQRLFLYVSAMALSESLLVKLEYIGRSYMHGALFYIVVSIGTPALLIGLAVASRHRWGCTMMSTVYTLYGVAFLWFLPLFPAEPKLGPVHQRVTQFIPWEFPLLIVVPSIAVDLLLQRTSRWRPLARGVAAGAMFVAVFVAVQWPFANFLMTSSARNWIFGAGYMDFITAPQSYYARHLFVPADAHLLRGIAIAAGLACATGWIAVWAGTAMQKVRR
jgi:hypothetical protein